MLTSEKSDAISGVELDSGDVDAENLSQLQYGLGYGMEVGSEQYEELYQAALEEAK